MADDITTEVEAIKTILTALEPLSNEIRSQVLGYVLVRLNVALPGSRQTDLSGMAGPKTDELPIIAEGKKTERQPTPAHIKDLKNLKSPKSASEMAALVAYYLENAPPTERANRINTKLVETYFKIAEFPLPKKPQFTLPNAKAAGYLDAVGNGEYKLNAVGHNLVVHSLPREKDGNKGRPSAKR